MSEEEPCGITKTTALGTRALRTPASVAVSHSSTLAAGSTPGASCVHDLSSAAAIATQVTQFDGHGLAPDSRQTIAGSGADKPSDVVATRDTLPKTRTIKRQQRGTGTRDVRRCGQAKQLSTTRSSKRQRGESAPDIFGGSIYDTSRVRTISTGQRNPDSNTSKFSLSHQQAFQAQQRSEDQGHFDGLVSTNVGGVVCVIGRYSGCWRRENSGPAFLFNYKGIEMHGAMHGKGVFKCTCEHPDILFPYMHTGDVYSGPWDNNMPHGNGQLLMDVSSNDFNESSKNVRYGRRYEGEFTNGAITGTGVYRGPPVYHGTSMHRILREYVGEFQDGTFHGSGTSRFSDYVDCDLSHLGEDDWDVFEGTHDRHGQGGFHGHGTLRYNHGVTRFGEGACLGSHYSPPGIGGWRCTPLKCGIFKLDPSDPRDVFGCIGDVYTGDFKHSLFHGRGTYSFTHPDTGCTVSYEADWLFGIRVGGTPQLRSPAVVTALPSRPVHCETATFPTFADIERQEAHCPAGTAPQREEVSDTSPNNNNGDEGYNKRGQDQRPTKTSLSEQKTAGEGACRELCPNGPSTEQIMDAIGRSSQEEQLLCFGTYLPMETAASASTLLAALKDVLPARLSQALHEEQQRQGVGCPHLPVATTSPNTQNDNHALALGSYQTATRPEDGHTSAATC